MVAPLMRCRTHDHMPGSPRYRVRRGGRTRGSCAAADVVVISPLTVWSATRRARLRRACDRLQHGTVGWTLNPFVAADEPLRGRRCRRSPETLGWPCELANSGRDPLMHSTHVG